MNINIIKSWFTDFMSVFVIKMLSKYVEVNDISIDKIVANSTDESTTIELAVTVDIPNAEVKRLIKGVMHV